MLHGQHEGKLKMGKKEPEGKGPDHHMKMMHHHMKALHKMAKKQHKSSK